MPEQDWRVEWKAFERGVIELLHALGYTVAHFRPALTKHGWRTAVSGDGKGFPDIIAVGHGRVVVAELKTGKARLRPEQQRWLTLFESVPGLHVAVWTPGNIQEIARELQALDKGEV